MVDLMGASDKPYTLSSIFFRSSSEKLWVSGHSSAVSKSATYSFAMPINKSHKLLVQYQKKLRCKSSLSCRNGGSLSFDLF
jgi:hypothetical protein